MKRRTMKLMLITACVVSLGTAGCEAGSLDGLLGTLLPVAGSAVVSWLLSLLLA